MKQSDNIIYDSEFFSDKLRVYGNNKNCFIKDKILSTEDCWVTVENLNIKNISFSFSARAPKDEQEVDIWACFRHYNRDYRYMIGLRGGNHKHLYLARMGALGYDKMLALCPLDWCAMTGVWYKIKVVCVNNKIAVYLNNEEKPRILCEDEDCPFDSGTVGLGGSYIRTEYKDISIQEVSEDILNNVDKQPDYLDMVSLPKELWENTRFRQRAQYRPYAILALPKSRIELSLDGNWLFIPDYEVKENPIDLLYDDSKAHIISVPSSWVPLQAWLEGEFMGDLNKGQNDNYYLEEIVRCKNQTFDYEKTKSAWYRHYIDFPKGIKDKHVILDFEAIALISNIYCNGIKVYENIGMFSPIQIDISEYIKEGRNVIAVEVSRCLQKNSKNYMESDSVDNNYSKARETSSNTSDIPVSDCLHREFCAEDIPHGFYNNNPGGIWKSVKLIISDKLHISDCWFKPTLNDASIEVEYKNNYKNEIQATLSYSLIHKTTGELLCEGDIESVVLSAGETRKKSFKTPKVEPKLWGPGTPNLYNLNLFIKSNNKLVDNYCEKVGFRTVEFAGSKLIYNGNPMWVRGANHMPAHIKPNDSELAKKYMRIALEHNVMATRTHVAPWGSTWLNSADEEGVMVSLEGTWPWLMISHIPSQKSLEIWKTELEKLFSRHKNRPSLFLVTLNNEMNFYLTRDSDEVIKEKGYLVQDGLKLARKIFPNLPLVCDSGYYRGPTTLHGRDKDFKIANGRYERVILPNNYDDGDMDDPHSYYGWYFVDFFHFMNGEFGRDITLPGRPCMSQECSLGYCRSEDGHATRFYLFEHQTPQTTTGKRAYEHNDPKYFQFHHSFQLQGLVEMFRRVEHERTCGVLLFAFETWFYHHHDKNRIQPMLSANRLKTAYQPVLASVELFSRHFLAGKLLKTNITLINDSTSYQKLNSPKVEAKIVIDNQVISTVDVVYEDVPYFETKTMSLSIQIPNELPKHRNEAKLILNVWENNKIISENDYDILIVDNQWLKADELKEKTYYFSDDIAIKNILEKHGLQGIAYDDISTLSEKNTRLVIGKTLKKEQATMTYNYIKNGGKVVAINQRNLPKELIGQKDISYTEDKTEIITMNIPESSIFNDIGELDTAWFDNGRDVPYVAYGRYTINRMDSALCALAETLQWHNYISHPTDYCKIGGSPLFSMNIGKGAILVSSIRTDADDTDPVAYRLTENILSWNFDEVL